MNLVWGIQLAKASWGSRSNWRHVMLGMTAIISSTRSCCVTPSKHRLLQHSRASPVSITWHDPEAECGSPDRCKDGEKEQIHPRIGQSVSNRGEDHTIFYPFRPL